VKVGPDLFPHPFPSRTGLFEWELGFFDHFPRVPGCLSSSDSLRLTFLVCYSCRRRGPETRCSPTLFLPALASSDLLILFVPLPPNTSKDSLLPLTLLRRPLQGPFSFLFDFPEVPSCTFSILLVVSCFSLQTPLWVIPFSSLHFSLLFLHVLLRTFPPELPIATGWLHLMP